MARARSDGQALLDAESFRRAVLDHGPAIHRFLSSRLGPDAADDAMSQTFVEAWRLRHKFVDPSDNGLEAWLVRIASFVVASHRRQERRWLQMKLDTARAELDDIDGGEEHERAMERADAEVLMRRARIAEAILELSRREREPLLLHLIEGHSYEEIARILELPIGTVRSRISRVKDRLAAHVERTGEVR